MGKKEELNALLMQMREGSNEEARAAVKELREKGWLTDGSLYRADLRGANLSSADLRSADLRLANLRLANLIGTNLRLANLIGADLRGATLYRADLSDADLIGANLIGANLGVAYLSGADLDDANLRDTNLRGANLSGANLHGANLSGADLSSANLHGANLHGANFENAQCRATNWASLDLSVARNLEDIHHQGPSTVGIDTLYLSGGNIPKEFLRGCGVPPILIAYVESLVSAERPFDFYSCFISYSSDDEAFAEELYQRLYAKDVRVWKYTHNIKGGQFIHQEIDRGIQGWDKLILCCSKSSLHSHWVDEEIRSIRLKEGRVFDKSGEKQSLVVPLNLDGHLFDDYREQQGQWFDWITARNALKCVGWENWGDAQWDTFVSDVMDALAPGRMPPPVSKL